MAQFCLFGSNPSPTLRFTKHHPTTTTNRIRTTTPPYALSSMAVSHAAPKLSHDGSVLSFGSNIPASLFTKAPPHHHHHLVRTTTHPMHILNCCLLPAQKLSHNGLVSSLAQTPSPALHSRHTTHHHLLLIRATPPHSHITSATIPNSAPETKASVAQFRVFDGIPQTEPMARSHFFVLLHCIT